MSFRDESAPAGESAAAGGEDPRLRLLVERAPVAMGIVNREGGVEFANPAFARRFGEELAAARDLVEFLEIGSPSEEDTKRALAYWQDEVLEAKSGHLEPNPFHGRLVTPDGIKDVVFRAMIVGDKMVAVLEDVTGFRRAEELEEANQALRASEAKYRKLHESMADAFVSADMEGRFLEANRPFEELVGYSIAELRGLHYQELTPEKWQSLEERLLKEQFLRHGQTEVFEKEYRRKDGTTVPVELRVFMIRDDDGEPAGMWAIVRDISERKRFEEDLRRSVAKYRRLHESMTDAFVSVTMDGRISECNQAYREMLGYSEEELLELTYVDLTPEKWHAFEERIVQEQILPQGYSEVYEKEYRRKDGCIIPVELRTFLIRDDDGESAAMWAIVRDISDRKNLEEQLRRSNAELEERVAKRTAALEDRMGRYQSLFNALADMVLVVDAEGRILEANDASVEYMGYSREELLSMSHTDIECDVTPEEREQRRRGVIAGVGFSAIYRLSRKDGSCFPAEITVSPGEADGEPVAIAVVRDVTERERAETVIRESEERFRRLSEAAFEGIGVTQDGLIVDVNQRLAETLGYTVDEMHGRPALDFIAPDYRELVAHNVGSGHEEPYEADFLCKDGSIVRLVSRGVATVWNGREARVTALHDLTEEKRLEAELAEQRAEVARTHKLAMLSEVSAGVLHQVSQPLSAIGNNIVAVLDAFRSCQVEDCGTREPLEDVEQDLKRLRETMKRLRALAHPDQQIRTLMDLNEIVQDSIELSAKAARRGRVRFEVSPAPELPPVRIDAVQLGQALSNLFQNAIDATASCVPERRRVEVVTEACDEAEVQVLVRDGGPGIPPEAQARLFEPFFTTKPEGTGIGLSLSHTIVAAHKGRIEGFNNEDGPGATFRLVLPIGKEDQ